jgi:pyridoxamine 5'-phosphate oxidase
VSLFPIGGWLVLFRVALAGAQGYPDIAAAPEDWIMVLNYAASPFEQFDVWMKEAVAAEINDPNAMVVATATAEGRPSLRTVLLKGTDSRGFVFYTNKTSRKADEIAANPHVSLLFFWKSLHRQIRIEGTIEDVTDAEADAYYATRARISRLGAWASIQSRPLPERSVLEGRLAEMEGRYPGDAIPRPPYWSGYRVLPSCFEFWQDMPFRLHDRTIYVPEPSGQWSQSKLYP